MSPEMILKYAKELYGRVPERAYIIAIGAASLDIGEGLTPQVAPVVRRLVKHLSYWLTR